MGTTPYRLVSPTVGLIPTTELNADGQSMDASVSVPNVTAAMFAAAATPGPALDPHGVDDGAYGFCSPSIRKERNSKIKTDLARTLKSM
jgi:hypothetical protein